MLKTILKVVGGIVAVIVLFFGTIYGLTLAKVDISSFFVMISPKDKSTRPSPGAVSKATFGTTNCSIDYSKPAKKGREVFGKLVPYGEVWRTGANEATSISFDKDVVVAGKPLKAGTYQLFTIPTADKWTIIFNSKSGQWGAFFHDEKSDVLRVEVPQSSSDEALESLALSFETAPETGLLIAWDKTRVFVPISAQ
ncbi:MAG: DUF2911 domain-containing protein [Candidatus Kapabacteria bacterium]|jgi:hypothetical protein|nr:DUF2911 domain-containing protein [Candidatus Kapabacteria bacterium]